MENETENILKTVIDTVMKKEAAKFRGMIQKELATKVQAKIEELKKALSGNALGTSTPKIVNEVPATMSPSAPPATAPVRAGDLKIVPTAAGANKDDVSLDPNFEKEYFQKSYEYKGQNVIVKQVGTGFGKPVRIYINDRRWEFFPGPKTAEKATKEYIDSMVKAAKKNPELASKMTAKVASDREAGVAAAPPQK
jgi:hypothetical protein